MGRQWCFVGLALCALGPVELTGQEGKFVPIESGVTASLRGVSIVDDRVMWVSGAEGTVLRSGDGGKQFERCWVVGHEKTDFRDVHGIDDKTAVIMAAGVPPVLLRTEDGGETWVEVYRHSDPAAFFDSMTIRSDGVGLVLADPMFGRWLMLSTDDYGKSWSELPESARPVASEGEHGFAASGSLVATDTEGRWWLGLGGAAGESLPSRARVLRGQGLEGPWHSLLTPLIGGESSGIFSIAIGSGGRIGVVGGDYQDERVQPAAAYSDDDGRSWSMPTETVRGYRSSLAIVRYGERETWFACGPTGIDISIDRGESWRGFSEVGYHAMLFSETGGSGLAIGSGGRIARWVAQEE